MDLEVWCDGSGTHCEGPACIGVLVMEVWEYGVGKTALVEASEYVGDGTNNLAELRAIRRGLYLAEQMGGLDSPVQVFSDSEYAIGCCTRDWEFRANAALIRALRAQVARHAFVRFVHVDGHAGIIGNEIADWLAGEARRRHLLTMGIERKPKRRPDIPREVKPKKTKATKKGMDDEAQRQSDECHEEQQRDAHGAG